MGVLRQNVDCRWGDCCKGFLNLSGCGFSLVTLGHGRTSLITMVCTIQSIHTDLRDVAQFATVEAKTTMRVFLHQVGAVQVHRLGGWRHGGSRRPGEGGGGSSGSDNRRGAEQGWLTGGSLQLGVLEPPPLVVEQGGLVLPLCPSGWHGLEPVDALSAVGV